MTAVIWKHTAQKTVKQYLKNFLFCANCNPYINTLIAITCLDIFKPVEKSVIKYVKAARNTHLVKYFLIVIATGKYIIKAINPKNTVDDPNKPATRLMNHIPKRFSSKLRLLSNHCINVNAELRSYIVT